MKILVGIFLIGLLAVCSACGSEDEVPPRFQDNREDYQLPKANPLTESEREIWGQLKDEYANAIKGVVVE